MIGVWLFPRASQEDHRRGGVERLGGCGARRFGFSPSCAITPVVRRRKTGSYAPGYVGGQRKRNLAGHENWLHEVRAAEPDIALAELRERLATEGIEISRQGINDTLHALGYRYKNTARAAEPERAEVARKRRQWRHCQTRLRPERLVFIEGQVQSASGPSEAPAGAKTNMARRRERSLKGQRLKAAIPWDTEKPP